MREILNYPETDTQNLDTVKDLIQYIADNPGCDSDHELSELNRITGKDYSAIHFFEYWGWTDLDALAEEVLTPEPPCVRDLSKEEIKEIVLIIKDSLISLDDCRTEYYMELLHKSLPLLGVQRYIRLEDDEETIVNNMLHASSSSVIAL